MTDKEIIERAKEAEKRTGFGQLVHSPISKGVNSAFGIGFIEGMVEYRKSLQGKTVSEDFTKALAECIHQAQCAVVDPMAHAEIWKKELLELAKGKMPVSEDLDSFATNYAQDKPYPVAVCQAVKVGAKWQAEQDKQWLAEEHKHIFAKGRDSMKQQIMAKAIDGDITFDYYDSGNKTYGCVAHDSFCLEDFGLKDRDKVKVIVIKE